MLIPRTSKSIFGFIMLLAIMTAACAPQTTPTAGIEIGPDFTAIYTRHGGDTFFGPAISPVFPGDGALYQYTSKALFKFDPRTRQVSFAPIGRELGLPDTIDPEPDPNDEVYLNGHTVWDEVIPLFKRLGREAGTGLPLTGVIHNNEKGRYEQYFENLGFYRLDNDPLGTVHLLAYGDWLCAEKCTNLEKTIEDAVNKHTTPPSPQQEGELRDADASINTTAARLGNDLPGFPLTETYLNPEELYIKIFENIVLYSNPADPGPAEPLSIVKGLGVVPDSLSPRIDDKGYYFYPIRDGLGYNIRNYYLEFITTHGGMEVSGPPITEEYRLNDSLFYRQCFTNYCLEYHPNAPKGLRVRAAPLGYSYLSLNGPRVSGKSITPALEGNRLTIQAWEAYSLLAADQSQEIFVAVYQNNIPVANIKFVLTVIMPDGNKVSYEMKLTGEDGMTSHKLGYIKGSDLTQVPYELCMIGIMEQEVCVRQAFILWDTIK